MGDEQGMEAYVDFESNQSILTYDSNILEVASLEDYNLNMVIIMQSCKVI